MTPDNATRTMVIVAFLGCSSLLLNIYLLSSLVCLFTSKAVHSGGDLLPAYVQQSAGAIHDIDLYSNIAVHVSSGRMLVSSGSSGSSSGGHGAHPQDSLLFLFNAIIFGVVLLHISTLPQFHHMQQTVALFVLGVLYSLVQEGLKFNDDLGVVGVSYDMWMIIDPHLMLFTLLPALLAGDAMALDTNVVKKVAGQCIYLAGPGVICNTFAAAGFLKFYLSSYDWPFELCLTTGAILAATDPVAVVSLLKQLGAAPALTILIQGESLLNDGTAIVCFVLAYDMLQGESYGFGEICVFVVRKAICACGLGWVIGWIFVVWISAASDRFEHHSSMIQVCLTICCAYWSFIIAEGVLDMSGVLCTVSASLVLADNMWSSVVDKHTLLHVWHVIEFLGNTLIFFLAGALTGNCMVHIPFQDYLHLLVIYVVMFAIRGLVIIGSLPVLRKLGKAQLPLSEAIVMTWGGLRGAVGLALAIQVSIEKAFGKVSDLDSKRVLFYTGGIAFLTLVVNAISCPALVKFLGLVQTDEVKQKLLMRVCSQMVRKVKLDNLKLPVRRALEEMMEKIDHAIAHAYNVSVADLNNPSEPYGSSEGETDADHHLPYLSEASAGGGFKSGSSDSAGAAYSHGETDTFPGKIREKIRQQLATPATTFGNGQDLVDSFNDLLRKMDVIPPSIFDLLNVPQREDLALSDSLSFMVVGKMPDPEVMELINVAFLSLVQAEYWNMIDEGEFIKGSSHPKVLLNSIAWATQSKSSKLADFDFIFKELGLKRRGTPIALTDSAQVDMVEAKNEGWAVRKSVHQVVELSGIIASGNVRDTSSSALKAFVTSTWFNVVLTTVIILNVINVFVEEANTDESGKSYSDSDTFWLVIEICFTFFFVCEFLIKLAAYKIAYFYDAWHLFDVFLVISGIFGVVVEIIWQNDEADTADVSAEARVFRVNRLFRALRLMRVFRLVQLLEVVRARWSGLEVSLHLASNMRIITILTAFARAHIKAERSLMKFYGKPKHFRGCELSRCIVDSRSAVCDAIFLAAFEIGKMEVVILERLAALRESGHITEDLTQFILEAEKLGVIHAKEAENLLQPLRNQQQKWFVEEKHHLSGIYDRSKTAKLAHASSFRSKVSSGSNSSFSDASTSSLAFLRRNSSPKELRGSRRSSLREAISQLQNPFEFSLRRGSRLSRSKEVSSRKSVTSVISQAQEVTPVTFSPRPQLDIPQKSPLSSEQKSPFSSEGDQVALPPELYHPMTPLNTPPTQIDQKTAEEFVLGQLVGRHSPGIYHLPSNQLTLGRLEHTWQISGPLEDSNILDDDEPMYLLYVPDPRAKEA